MSFWAKIILNVEDVIQSMKDAELNLLATSMAFVTVLSVIPLVAVSLSLFKAFGGLDHFINQVQPFIFQHLAPGTDQNVIEQMELIIRRIHSGALGATSFFALMFVATKLLGDVEKAVQRIWKITETRSLPKRVLYYWGVMIFFPLGIASTLGILSSRYMAFLPRLPFQSVSFIIIFSVLFFMYKVVPNCHVHLLPAIISAVLAALGLGVAQSGYVWATKNLLMYNKVYGSLAVVPIFLLWILIIWLIVLWGVAFTASIQNRKTLPEAIDI